METAIMGFYLGMMENGNYCIIILCYRDYNGIYWGYIGIMEKEN